MYKKTITTVVSFLLICGVLTGCASSGYTAEAPEGSENQTSEMTEAIFPSPEASPDVQYDMPVLTEYDDSYGYIRLNGVTILSFDFLYEIEDKSKLSNISISDCIIPEGVTLPNIDELTTLSITCIEGQDEVAFVNNSLPLPNLETLIIRTGSYPGGIWKDAGVLDEISTLVAINILAANPIEVIANNNHIEHLVIFWMPYEDEVTEKLAKMDLEGLENFKNVRYIIIYADFEDITPLSGCESLDDLEITAARSLKSLMPLADLENLAYIYMHSVAYDNLPEEDKAAFPLYTDYNNPPKISISLRSG